MGQSSIFVQFLIPLKSKKFVSISNKYAKERLSRYDYK